MAARHIGRDVQCRLVAHRFDKRVKVGGRNGLRCVADQLIDAVVVADPQQRLAKSIVSSCLRGLFSFGNGSQAIEIATAHFSLFFQTRLEIIE